MSISKGNEIWRSKLTKKNYIIKTIKDKMVVLESINGSGQVFTTLDNLKVFYTILKNTEEGSSENISEKGDSSKEPDPYF